jgi:hypothetical protein
MLGRRPTGDPRAPTTYGCGSAIGARVTAVVLCRSGISGQPEQELPYAAASAARSRPSTLVLPQRLGHLARSERLSGRLAILSWPAKPVFVYGAAPHLYSVGCWAIPAAGVHHHCEIWAACEFAESSHILAAQTAVARAAALACRHASTVEVVVPTATYAVAALHATATPESSQCSSRIAEAGSLRSVHARDVASIVPSTMTQITWKFFRSARLGFIGSDLG